MSDPAPPPPSPPVPFIDLVRQHHTIAGEVRDAVLRVFDEQAFVLGDEVAALEAEIATFCDSREAIGCNSGTDALILALMALDVGPGDEVITSPFTFFATASAIHRVGARPVFVDVDPTTFNLDVHRVEAAITPRTRAILPVHLYGQCAEMEPLWRVAVSHGLHVVEDACQSIGATYRGRRAGVLGTLGCFSFFPTKNLGGAGDGGIVTTDDRHLARRIRRLRVHGDVGGYEHLEVGLNSRLDAVQAAVLRVKLRHLAGWTTARRDNAARYERLFDHYELHDALVAPLTAAGRDHVFNQYVVRLPAERRDAVLSSLRADGIGCAVYYPKPLHLQTCFAHLGHAAGDLPESELAAHEVLALPIHEGLTPTEQERVVRGLARALGRADDRPWLEPPTPRYVPAPRRAA
jgi:dTDP-4-amino-4,6-dideoxygalactose transaminase